MAPSILFKALRDQGRATLALALFTAAYAGFIVALFPSINGIVELRNIFDRFPPAFRAIFAPGGVDITTPEGYLVTEFFSLIGPLLFFAYTIAIGGSATAAEEERGTIDLLMSLPVRRWRVVLEKYLALVAGTILLGIALLVGILAGGLAANLQLRLAGFVAVIGSVALLALLFGALAIFIGGLTGRRTFSIGVAFAVAVASYFVYSFSELVELLKPLRPFSPFTYYLGDNPLVHGLNSTDAGILAATTLVLVALAVLAFSRRDLRV